MKISDDLLSIWKQRNHIIIDVVPTGNGNNYLYHVSDLAAELISARAELAAMKDHTRWIPVTERLPEIFGEQVDIHGYVQAGELNYQAFGDGAYCADGWKNIHGIVVTHWRKHIPPIDTGA